ncbi:hypothetical protein [Enterococcus alishanensis]
MKLEIDTKKILEKALAEKNQNYKDWEKQTIEKNLGRVFDAKSSIRKQVDAIILQEASEGIVKNYLKKQGIEI